MKRVGAVILLSFVALVSGVGTRYVLSGTEAAAQTTMRPFVATVETTYFDGNGTERSRNVVTKAVRGDGSIVEVQRDRKFPDGNTYEGRIVIDASYKSRIVIDAATESVTTYPLTTEALSAQLQAFGSCSTIQGASQKTILGFSTVQKPISRKIGKTEVADIGEQWVAPELDCFPLESTIHAPKSTAYHHSVTTSVIPGEPPADLFTIPSEYQERSPEQVAAEYAKRFPGAAPLRFSDASTQGYVNARRQK